MSPKLELFLSGVTGYIGGGVLQKLLEHPKAAEFNITALIRSPDKFDGFKALGVTPLIGSLSDLDIIETQASKSDVVIAMADVDDIPSAEAILRGLKTRFNATGKRPIFIECSGTGVLVVDSRGNSTSDIIYDDANVEQMASIPESQPHRPVDLRVVNADQEGYVKTYLVIPSTIYHIGKGRLFDSGLSNKFSQQVPALIKAALGRGQGGFVGKGVNLWPHVDIDDVSDLFTVVLDHALTDPSSGHGRDGYYFGANGEYNFRELAETIHNALAELGRAKTTEPSSFTEEEIQKYFKGSYGLGTNSRAVANHSYSIGWKPKNKTADFYGSIKPEVEAWIAKGY